MKHVLTRRLSLISALAFAGSATLLVSSAPLPVQDGGSEKAPKAKAPVQPEDYGKWESLGRSMALSADGKWMAYTISRQNGNGDLRIRVLATDSTEVIEHGMSPQFSDDSNWLSYRTTVSREEREKLQKAGRPIPNKTYLRNLVTGETEEYEKIRSMRFSEDSRFAILQQERGASAMPGDLHQRISRRDLRDLIEYLSRLRGASPKSGTP